MDCVVYEDILKGVEGAKMGGFYVVGVEDVHSGYEKKQIKEGSDYYISSFEELFKQ
jgi:beta-phosphoglucomutase-like phosphatase (HAD superfamily)